jgi:helix-turn-helix protein
MLRLATLSEINEEYERRQPGRASAFVKGRSRKVIMVEIEEKLAIGGPGNLKELVHRVYGMMHHMLQILVASNEWVSGVRSLRPRT